MARADKYTKLSKMPEFYSDFTLNMELNPVTSQLRKVTNEESVKNSIRQLILTTRNERICQPFVGSKIYSLLFDPLDDVTSDTLKMVITEAIKNYEPRCTLQDVIVTPKPDDNSYFIMIQFSLINIPNSVFTFTDILKRAR